MKCSSSTEDRKIQGHQVIDRANLIVLFTPQQAKNTQTESKNESTNDPKPVSKDDSKLEVKS